MNDTTNVTVPNAVKNLIPEGLVVAIPFGGRPVAPQWAVGLALQDYPLNLYRRMTNRLGMPVAEAREEMVQEALDSGARYLWFLDDDVQPPFKAIRQLVYQLNQHAAQGFAAVSGVYFMKNEPTEPVLYKVSGGGAYWNWRAGDLFEVEAVGAGCLLLDLHQLKDLPRPWFTWTDKPGVTEGKEHEIMHQMGEDMYFCKLLREHGHRILVDSSIQCNHWDVKTGKHYACPVDSFPVRDERVSKAVTVPGFMSYKELIWLADAIQGKKLALELGSYQGRSTRALADNCYGRVIAFDSFEGIPTHPEDQQGDFLRRVFTQHLDDYLKMGHVVLVEGSHDDPAPAITALNGEKADFIFIDGDHSYKGCLRDINNMRPLLAEGGILAGHDASWPGVQKALMELSADAVVEFPDGTDIWFVKTWIRAGSDPNALTPSDENATVTSEEVTA